MVEKIKVFNKVIIGSIYTIINIIMNIIFPEKCTACKNNYISLKYPLCDDCLLNIQFIDITNRCQCCGDFIEDTVCLNCQRKEPFFSKSYFMWSYQDEIRHIVKMAKFYNRRSAVHFLKNNIDLSLLNHVKNSSDTIILRMVSSKKFIKILSKLLTSYLNIPIIDAYQKKKSKIQSKLLHEKDRFLELEKNLFLKKEIYPLISQYKKFIIIDDVWTTGATINLASKLLVDAGVPTQNIEVFAFFRRDKQS